VQELPGRPQRNTVVARGRGNLLVSAAGTGCGVVLPTVYRRGSMSTPESRHTADFKLSITKALADQLAERLAPLRPIPLTEDAVEDLDPLRGCTSYTTRNTVSTSEKLRLGCQPGCGSTCAR
jgi:hypothetical protein